MRRTAVLALLTLTLALPAKAQSLTLEEVVKTTLERHPAVRIQQRGVEVTQGQAVEAGASFDTLLGASIGHTHQETPIVEGARIASEREVLSDSTSLSLSSVTGTRWGMTIEPAVSIERIRQRFEPKDGMRTEDPQHRGTVGIQLTQPLLRGAGRTRAAGQEIAAKHGVAAAEQEVRFVGSARVLEAVLTYWELVAAQRQIELAEQAEKRAEQLLEDTAALVKADQRPAADLRQVEGNLADRRRFLNQSRATAFAFQRELGLAMGIPASDMDGMSLPSHALPTRPAVPEAVLVADDVATAFAERADLAAAERRVTAAHTRKDAARGNRLPALDLKLGAGYTGLSEDTGLGAYFGSLGQNVPGVGVNASLNLELPVLNKAREGAYLQRDAEHAIQTIARDEQRRQIETRVRIARNNLLQAVETLRAAEQASTLYVQAVEDERAKLQAGLATIIDVVVVQDRLLQVDLTRLAAQRDFAQALARYHFELGRLPEAPNEADAAHLSPLLGPT